MKASSLVGCTLHRSLDAFRKRKSTHLIYRILIPINSPIIPILCSIVYYLVAEKGHHDEQRERHVKVLRRRMFPICLLISRSTHSLLQKHPTLDTGDLSRSTLRTYRFSKLRLLPKACKELTKCLRLKANVPTRSHKLWTRLS